METIHAKCTMSLRNGINSHETIEVFWEGVCSMKMINGYREACNGRACLEGAPYLNIDLPVNQVSLSECLLSMDSK